MERPSLTHRPTTLLIMLGICWLQWNANQSSFLHQGLWLGSIWAGVAIGTLLLAWGRCLWIRWGVLVVLVAWHAGWMAYTQQQEPIRYVISFLAFMTVLAYAGHWLSLPVWQPGASAIAGVVGMHVAAGSKCSQFSIASLLALTVLVAVVAACGRAYQLPDPAHYFGVLLIACLLGTLTIMAQWASRFDHPHWRWIAATSVILASVACSFGVNFLMTVRDTMFYEIADSDYFAETLITLLTFSVLVQLFSLSGRKVPTTSHVQWSGTVQYES